MLAILRELVTERTRVWLTVFANAWGTTSISAMLAIGEGLRQAFGNNVKGIGEDLLILWPGESIKPYRGQLPQRINFNLQDLNHLKALPGIKAITPEYDMPGTGSLRYHNREYQGPVVGVEPIYGRLRNIRPVIGRFIDPLDAKHQQLVMVLGHEVAKRLAVPIQQTVILNQLPFTVIGVAIHKRQAINYQQSDNNLMWIPAASLRALWGDDITNFIVKIAPDVNPIELKAQIIQTIALPRGLSPSERSLVHLLDTAEFQHKTDQFLLGMEIFLGLAGLLTLIVAGVGIANVMFASISSATREIGIRKALGAQKYQILGYYIYQALVITAVGGLIGVVVSYALASFINQLSVQSPFFAGIGKPQLILSPAILAIIVSILGAIGLIAGLFPARRAARVDPVVALRSV